MVLLAVVEQVMNVLGGILCQELDPLSQKYHLIMRIELQPLIGLLAQQFKEDILLDFESFAAKEGQLQVELCRLSPWHFLHLNLRVVVPEVIEIFLSLVLVCDDAR